MNESPVNQVSRPLWVLIVEDDRALNQALAEQLLKNGFKVVSAFKVSEAISKLSQQQFDCVLLDLHFEYRNGDQVVDFIRNHPRKDSRSIPILVVSGLIDPGVIQRLGKVVNGFLVKPFEGATLMARLSALLPTPSSYP